MRDYKGEEQDADNPSYRRRTAIDPADPYPDAPSYQGYIHTAATLGPPIPLVWGTERVRVVAIYAQGRTYKPDNNCWIRTEDPVLNGVYNLERTDTTQCILALCEAPVTGQVIAIVRGWRDGGNAFSDPAQFFAAWNGGVATASEWVLGSTATSPAWITGLAAGQAWQGMCQFRAEKFVFPAGKLPGCEVELSCPTAAGLSDGDAWAWDVVKEILTDERRGLGLRGADGTADTVVDVLTGLDSSTASGFKTYCENSGLGKVSRKLEEAVSARELLQDLMEATGSAIVRSGDRLKVVPLAEEAVGAYAPASTGVLIDDDELLYSPGRDTVTVEITPSERIYNAHPVSFRRRSALYRDSTVEYIEPSDAAARGVHRAPRRHNAWIKTAEHALAFSSLLARRSLSIRRRFRFRLSPRWIALEPGDLIALTHARLGLVEEPIRIVAIEEDQSGVREIFAEEWPAGLSRIVDLTPEAQDGMGSVVPNPFLLAQAAQDAASAAQTTADGKADADLTNVVDGSVTPPLLDAPVVEPISRALSALGQSSDGKRVWYRGNVTRVQNGCPVLMDAAWAASTAYAVGDRRLYGGNVYVCDVAGTSGSTGPTGTSADITDGSARWDYVGTMASQERARLRSWRGHLAIGGGMSSYMLTLSLQPMDYRDNLDGLRTIWLDVYDNTGTWVDNFICPLTDRTYRNETIDSSTDNRFDLRLSWLGPTCTVYGSGYLDAFVKLTMASTVGWSVRHYRLLEGGDTTLALGGVSIPTVSSPPPPPADADPPGGTCPAPETLILMADGTQKPAGDLVPGDMVRTQHESTWEWGDFPVTYAETFESDRLTVTMHDGRTLTCSPDHRVLSHGEFRAAKGLRPVFMIEGPAPGEVVRVEQAASGPVVKITVDGAHTYVSAGLLSHNAKKLE